VEIQQVQEGTTVLIKGRALDVIADLLKARSREGKTSAVPERSDDVNDDAPPFQGGAAGYIGYEYGGVLERLPKPTDDLGIPDVVMGLYDWAIGWDHQTGRCWLFADAPETLDALAADLAELPAKTPNVTALNVPPSLDTTFTSTMTRAEYERAVDRVRDYIRAGDIFQANLSQRFSAPLHATPWQLYNTLRETTPAPFAAFFETPDFAIASASPERFLKVHPSGLAETHPIKGTRPRAADPVIDQAHRDALLASEKDAAEHVMIVDVLRNDLARVSEYGSVRVPSLMRHEQYASVHHLVSTVVSQLRPDASAIDLLHAAFPGGSITGAPKIRAMEIIAELELVTRGVYCGAIGYISPSGAMDTNIAIRTCLVRDGQVYFSAGGGIVADSAPAAEYEETLVKANALMHAIRTANAMSPHPARSTRSTRSI